MKMQLKVSGLTHTLFIKLIFLLKFHEKHNKPQQRYKNLSRADGVFS